MDKKVIHRVFEAQLGPFTDAVAIEADNRRITYQELNKYANRLAHLLQSVGSGYETIVHVAAPASIELVGAMLAVFKSGGIYLPIDLAFSERLLTQVFTATYEGIVVVAAEWEAELRQLTDRLGIVIRHLIVLEPAQAPRLLSQTPVGLQPAAYEVLASWEDNLAQVVTGADSNYIFYTSGSTGAAKAIVGAHASLSHFLHWELREFGLGPTTRVSQLVQVTFDASLRDMLVPLLAGGTLCIPPAASKENPLQLLTWLTRAGITLVHCVPSLFRVLTTEWQKSPDAYVDLSRLDYVLMSGEALFARDVVNWRSVAGFHTQLVNFYGATETTLIKTFYRIGEVSADAGQRIPIGVPISNTSVAVVRDGRVCKSGEVGELYIKTPFATKGYFRNEALTQQCFVQNPLQTQELDIVYKTGDLGCWLPDGNLELLGRLDGQVKVNGIRVELPDVERALRTVAGVTGAVVQSHNTDRGTSLCAYYTGTQQDAAQLREALLRELNAQVIPSWFIWLPAFPLNLNGKVDKHALPSPQEAAGDVVFDPPVGEVEIALAACWQDVLGHQAFGRLDSFFGVGGHSLRAIQLMSRISRTFGVQLRVADVFAHTTIATQSELISSSQHTIYQQIQPVPHGAHYPLSPAQRRLWILSQFEESAVAYHMPGVFVLEGQLHVESLQVALVSLVQRHEILRTVFREDDHGVVRQFIQPAPDEFPLGYADFRGAFGQQDAVRMVVQSAATHPFDLTNGPLLRVNLYQTADDRWVFAYVMHHIISDGWSMNILVNELLAAYNAQVLQQPYAPTPLRIQYKDYAAWQQAQLEGELLAAHRQFWLAQLNGELPVLELPLDKKRPVRQTFNGASISQRWDSATGRALRARCQEQDCTLFMGLVAALNVLLYRYTGQEDIILGSPTAGREHLDLETQIGFYISTLVLRNRFSGQQSFQQLLGQVRQVCLNAFEHQAYPFDILVDDLQLRQDRSRNALYDVALTLQNTSRLSNEPQHMEQVSIYPYEGNERLICRCDLLFIVTEDGDALDVSLEYNRDLFEQSTAERLILHLKQLIQGLAAASTLPIQQVGYLNAQEREQLVLGFNGVAVPYPPAQTIVALFEQQARTYPEQAAVVCEGRTLSYREVDAQANRLANHLRTAYHVGADELVGLMLDRSEKLIISILAVLKAGAAYVPIDPDYPEARKNYILQDTGLQLLLTQLDYLFDLSQYTGELFAVDVQLDDLDAPTTAPDAGIRPEHLAYVIYTSGSTGMPKGVMIEHAGIANTIQAQCAAFDIRPGERGLQFASASFDASVSEIFIILAAGGTLHVISEATKKNPVQLERYLATHRIDIATLPPAYLQLLSPQALRPMRKLITAGEAAIRDRVSEFALHGQYYNAYGPTEVSICGTIYPAAVSQPIDTPTVPIGAPIANATVYIVDETLALLPIGVVGQLAIGGRGLARGYWRNPALTAEKFVLNPFEPGQRLYLTGDLARWLPDGNVEFVGRRDNQVKINGYRIELGEIEQALLRQPTVQEATAQVRDDAGGGHHLVAYYVPAIGWTPTPESLRAALGAQLPAYMVPGYFVPVEQIPLTVSGKVDRKKLPEPSGLAQAEEATYVAPRTELETQLGAIWEQCLGRSAVGVTDDFFDLGGSSLKAMLIIKQVTDELGYSLPIKVLFAEKSVEGAARYLLKQLPAPAVSTAPTEPALLTNPVSYNQLNYFSAWNMGSDVVVETYEYAELDPSAFQWAVTQLVQRHEILRTVFVQDAGGVRQQVLPHAAVPGTMAAPVLLASEEQWQQVLDQESRRAFDLATAPLFAVSLYQLAGQPGYRVVAALHHILTDGYSAGLLQAELLQLCAAYQQHGVAAAALPPLPCQYQDFARWQHTFVRSAEGLAHRAYWQGRLQGLEAALPQLAAAELPPHPNVPAVLMTTILSGERYAELQRFVRAQGLTQPALLLATLTLFVHQLQGQTDVVLSATVSGRNSRFYRDLDVSGLIGFFANVLLLRNTVRADEPVADYLQRVQDGFLEDLSHDAYPFLRLVAELSALRPELLPATGFLNYHNYQHVSTTNYAATQLDAPSTTELIAPMQRAFGLTVTEYANCLRLQFKFNPAAFVTAGSAAVSLEDFLALLQRMIHHPLRPLADLRPQPADLLSQ